MGKARGPKTELPISDPARLKAALAGLERRERRIVELRYGIGEAHAHSLEQVGRRFGISRERVRQIETRAVQRIAESEGQPAAKPARAAKRRTPPEPCLPREALRAWTLLLLRREAAHGYELRTHLQRQGEKLGPRLYRLLRELEQDGLVRSSWTNSTDGPERRVYKLTATGARQLRKDAESLDTLLRSLQRFFEHYGE